MQTKLTLTVSEGVIETAKDYAKKNKRSLSNVVEEYLKSLSTKKKKKSKYHGIVQELKGSVKMPKDFKAYKEILQDALIEKYLK